LLHWAHGESPGFPDALPGGLRRAGARRGAGAGGTAPGRRLEDRRAVHPRRHPVPPARPAGRADRRAGAGAAPAALLRRGPAAGGLAPEGVRELVELLPDDGWKIAVPSPPDGPRFHRPDRLAELTGEQVRVEYRLPGTGAPLPPADAVPACPLTFNSTNKFAQGIADCFAIGLLCEMAGHGVPTVVVPHCKPQLAAHPAFQRSLETLASIPAVTLLHDPDTPEDARLPAWGEVVAEVRKAAGLGG